MIEEGQKKQKQQLGTKTNHTTETARTYKQNENYLIFADDTNLLLPEEPPQETIQRLKHYSILTKQEN